jgi:protein Tex
VKAGQVVKVKVVEVDAKRNRVALTMRLNDTAAPRSGNSNPSTGAASRPKSAQSARPALGSAPAMSQSSAMAAAFAKLKERA